MITVSNEFKKAIKGSERKIKGYVEVLYDLPDVGTVTSSSYMPSTYTDASEITNGVRIENIYGSLDYLPLDGSVLTMDTGVNQNAGYISDEIYQNIATPEFTITLAERTELKGITLYFRTNIPTGLNIAYVEGYDYTTDIITNNDKETVQIIFDEPKSVDEIIIYIDSVEYPDRKIYINEVDLGVTQVYKDQDLIEFTVDEEVNKFVEEVPINETNITLNNMSDLFNPLNPKGIVPYLSENTIIKPYIGVLTENLGVEYVKMGEFYFDSYTNNSDATTTLVGKNILKVLETEPLKDNNEFNFFQLTFDENDFNNFMANYDYTYNMDWKRNCGLVSWKTNSLLKFLSDISFWQENIFYANRNNELLSKKINVGIKDAITKTELINDANFKYIEKTNTFKVVQKKRTGDGTSTSRQLIQETVTLETSPQIFLIKSDSPDMMLATVTQSGGTSATIITAGFYMAFVKVEGNIGQEVTLTFNTTQRGNFSQTEVMLTNKGQEKEKELRFDSDIYYVVNPVILESFNLLNIAPSYKMNFEYSGDPSLEAGDYINVETPYGYKTLFIQKNRFKFDGGLEGSIEGVE